MSGRTYYSLALDTAQEIGDHHLIALTHGYAAHLAASEGMITTALDRLAAATQHVSSTHAIASWLAALEATLHADRGDYPAARCALDRADAASNQPVGCLTPAPSFCDSCTPNLAVTTGYVLLQAGDYHGACTTLAVVLGESRPIPRRQHVLALVVLAIAELHSGDFAAAYSHAMQAARSMHQTAYAFGAARIRTFRAMAEQTLNNEALRALDEELTHIAA